VGWDEWVEVGRVGWDEIDNMGQQASIAEREYVMRDVLVQMRSFE
jgi:hypothetical protein